MPQTGMATLVIETIPAGAQVFVDDEFVGQTTQGPVVIGDLEPEEYDVLVSKDGFRSWDQTIDLRSGEQRTLSARLQEGQALVVTGVWKNPAEPSITYVLNQQGHHVTMAEVTTSLLGTVVTAEGEGQLKGKSIRAHVSYGVRDHGTIQHFFVREWATVSRNFPRFFQHDPCRNFTHAYG